MIDEAVNILKEYISMENVFFIPFLIFIGRCVKKSKRIDDTLIPNILGVLGIFLCSLVSLSQNQPVTWINWVLLITVSVGQGICVSSVSVFLNQWFKQNQKFKTMKTFDGEIIESAYTSEDINQKSQMQAVCYACGQVVGGETNSN